MKYYVISDPHGYYKQFEKALRKAGFFDEKEPCKLVVCGDLLDRGEEANKIIEFLLKLKEEEKLIYILGNHEDLLVQCLHKIAGNGIHEIASGMSHHYSNKTWDTLLQLSNVRDNANKSIAFCKVLQSSHCLIQRFVIERTKTFVYKHCIKFDTACRRLDFI